MTIITYRSNSFKIGKQGKPAFKIEASMLVILANGTFTTFTAALK